MSVDLSVGISQVISPEPPSKEDSGTNPPYLLTPASQLTDQPTHFHTAFGTPQRGETSEPAHQLIL